MKLFFTSSENKEARLAQKKYEDKYGNCSPEESDIIVPIGGDGFLLKTLHKYKNIQKSFYGINYGSIGFLMNKNNNNNLEEKINKSNKIQLKPLNMTAINIRSEKFSSIAFNEISLMRQTHQAAKILIEINKIKRMNELVCDGVLVSTAAGSTAYNFSAHGSILPLDSRLLALTPISAFRPRRWRGALISENSKIRFLVNHSQKRSVSVTADFNEFRDITEVEIKSSDNLTFSLLFDNDNSIEEKVINEQFYSN